MDWHYICCFFKEKKERMSTDKKNNKEEEFTDEQLSQNSIEQSEQFDEVESTNKEFPTSQDSCNDESSEEVEITKEPTSEELLDKANKELAETKDKYLRLMAEFDNYRKRVVREKTELILNGGERVLTSILPVLDDFERAEANMKDDKETEAFREGISLIIDKLKTTLEKNGLKRIDPVGETFNVDYHEAIAMVPSNSEEVKGKVIDCVQCGYMLNDKVIRHAKVAVAE